MKPTPTLPSERAPLLAFGAHPDDIEFGCGGVIAVETLSGRPVHFVVGSRGEAGTHGTARGRSAEAARAAARLGATLEFVDLGGDSRIEARRALAVKLAGVIREHRPAIVLAPTGVENQHPDHSALSRLVRDAARLARYGGVRELKRRRPHAIGLLLYYAVTTEAEPAGVAPVLIDISAPAVLQAWQEAMAAHASQALTRDYLGFQLARARVHGHRAGVSHAQPLFPNDPLVFASLAPLARGARHL